MRERHGKRRVKMGNLLRVLNDKGTVPKVEFFVDFESKYLREREGGRERESTNIIMKDCNASYKFYNIYTPSSPSVKFEATASHYHNIIIFCRYGCGTPQHVCDAKSCREAPLCVSIHRESINHHTCTHRHTRLCIRSSNYK